MVAETSDRVKRAEAVAILNALVLDMLVGVRSLDLVNALARKITLSPSMRVGLGRLSTVHLILALAKWSEFYKHYKSIIPRSLAQPAKRFYKELVRRGVREFRNEAVGHIWDKDKKGPLSPEEVARRLAAIVAPDEATFHQWIYNPGADDRVTHLVGLTEAIRDALDPGPESNEKHRAGQS